jgi:hypothetical protein
MQIFSFAEVSLISKVLCDGRKLFGSKTFWRLTGFRHSEKSMKARPVVCGMLKNLLTTRS